MLLTKPGKLGNGRKPPFSGDRGLAVGRKIVVRCVVPPADRPGAGQSAAVRLGLSAAPVSVEGAARSRDVLRHQAERRKMPSRPRIPQADYLLLEETGGVRVARRQMIAIPAGAP
jgi:hypothetical protein